MIMLRRHQPGSETKPADHHVLAHHHLALDTFCGILYRYIGPVQMFRQSVATSVFVLTMFVSGRHFLFPLFICHSFKARTAGRVFWLNIDHAVETIFTFSHSGHHPEEIYLTTRSCHVWVISPGHQHAVAFTHHLH